MCLTPITLVKNYRNMNERTSNACNIVPCGTCVLCLKRRSASWAFRLRQQEKISKSSCFITLTYEETPLSYNGNPTLKKRDYQLFMKKLRRSIKNTKQISSIKYYACGEYGERSKRPHYHAIMFNLPNKYIKNPDHIEEIWSYGNIHFGKCENASIRYVTNYMMKGKWEPEGELDDREKEFSVMSKKLGVNYLTPQIKKYHKERLVSYITHSGGKLQALPRYFRDQIFTKEEKIILNESAEEAREAKFLELFDNWDSNELTWKKDQIRKQEKENRLRVKV